MSVSTVRLRQTAEWLNTRADIVEGRKAYHLAIEYREVAVDLCAAADELDRLRRDITDSPTP